MTFTPTTAHLLRPNRTLYVADAAALGNLENECEGFAESHADDGFIADAEACLAARDWLATLREHPVPFVVHVPEEVRHTVSDAVDNLSEYDVPPSGARLSFEDITDDTARRARFDAAQGWRHSTPTRAALVEAFNAMVAVGASPGALLTVGDLLAQRGCWEPSMGEIEGLCGARDDFLTSVCDVVMCG